jgi:hypothetical protein
MSSNTEDEQSNILMSVCKSLVNDRLQLARYLRSYSDIRETEFFVSEPVTIKVKALAALATAIPIVLSVIQQITSPPD